MHLKSITLKGFKSFPDRTRLEFGPGVSVVVGPNGSGKSNITDAVLWALGEQSAAAVRGSSMQDVIFAGSPGRQAATSAEVELVLDDSGGLLGLGAPEVSILRRLDRGGEGEYRLAGARCRLVDVIEVLSDTGLGKEMHSVISQGRVESLVTSKPRDRRLLIEEAAGLGKHRKRRRRAQLKLARTQQNLDRALDVEREARSRLRPLKRQAEAAELHQRLERQTLEARWELARDDLRSWRSELQSAEASVDEARGRRADLERELEAVATRREAAEEALAARSARREELSRRSFRAQSASERVAYRAEALAATRATVQGRVQRARELLATFRSQAAADQGDEQPLSLIAALEQELTALKRDRDAEIAAHVEELERRRVGAERLLAERSDASGRAHHERQQAERSLEEARRHLREAERAVEVARREAAKVGGELASVNQFLRSHTRPVTGATALADRLEVDPGYETALAAALDGRLGAALATDRGEAGRLLDGAGEAGGRVLIAGPSQDHHHPPEPAPGAAPLSSHVRGHDQAAVIARALLRDTWVVENIEGLPEGFEGVAVTRSGRVWVSRTRELRQAPALGEDRILAERNQREELIRASEDAAQGEVSARMGVERATELVSHREAEREAAVTAHRAAVRERDEAAEEEQRLRGLIERRREAPDEGPRAARRAQLTAELDAERRMVERSRRERSDRERRTEVLSEAVQRDESLLPEITRLIASLQTVGEAIDYQRDRFEQALAADREAGEKVALELRSCAQQEAELQNRLHAENEGLTEVEVQAQRARDQASDVEKELAALSTRLGLDPEPPADVLEEEQRDALRQRIERLVRRREQLGPVNPLAQEEYREAVEHVEELERQREDLETALRELEKLIRDTDRQIRDSFERTFAAAAQNFEEVVQKLFPGGRGRLRLVHAREEAPARTLGAQDAEEEDLPAAQQGEDAPTTDDEDQLLGVEIEITPAGKEMKRLSLLSGGEKSMTALAFLFAVFLARPCPFYILDEVEAALDDLNIDRFLDLLRSYSERAQFIVVTHQKRTMEAADSLYGVSMGSDGISKVISRRLPSEQAAA
jgi:chromosome segregation protein